MRGKGAGMRTIAIEEHFLSRGFREVMQRHASNQGGALPPTPRMTAERQVKLADLDTLRLQDMDTSGIDLQVISDIGSAVAPRPGDEGVQLAREANDQLAEACAVHPDRFAGFATLPMTKPEAAALSVPIYLHPTLPPASVREAYYTGLDPAVGLVLATSGWGWHSEVGLHALRLIVAGVFDRLPTLQIIIGHMGEMIPFMLARINDMLTPMVKQLQQPVPAYFLRNFHITTSGFFTDPPLLLAMQVMGADRILFAVDYPLSTNEQGRAFLDHASVSPVDKEKISHLNAERLLRLAHRSSEHEGDASS